MLIVGGGAAVPVRTQRRAKCNFTKTSKQHRSLPPRRCTLQLPARRLVRWPARTAQHGMAAAAHGCIQQAVAVRRLLAGGGPVSGTMQASALSSTISLPRCCTSFQLLLTRSGVWRSACRPAGLRRCSAASVTLAVQRPAKQRSASVRGTRSVVMLVRQTCICSQAE